jgi:type IV pilus assembly protein PilM
MGEDGTNFEILLTVAKAQSMLGFCAAVSSSGHSLTQATPSLLALYDGFQYSYPDMRESTLVVDVGARSIQLLLVENGRFVGRTLNFGGNAVTQSMADELGLEFTAAEKHKMQLLAVDRGESAPPLRLALQNGVAAFCAKLRAEIVRSTISLRQQLSVAHPTSVYVTGRAAQLPIVGQLLTEEMKVPVHRLEAIRRVDVSSAARGANADFVSVSPQLVGLASRLVTKRPMTPNLLPSVVRDELAFRRRQPALVAAAALLVTALIPPLHHFHSLAEAGQAKSAEMEAEAEPLRHIQTRMTELQRKIDEARSALADWQNVQDKKTTWLRFLADLQGRLVAVEDVWLESLSIVRPAGLKTGNPAPIEPAELRLVVSGRLLDQSNPISNVSPESYERVKRLVASIRESEFVAVVEQERFDNTQPGILRFDFTLVVQPQLSL